MVRVSCSVEECFRSAWILLDPRWTKPAVW
jgi:hypothetical protein